MQTPYPFLEMKMIAGLGFGLGLFSNLFSGIFGSNANSQSQYVLNSVASQENNLIKQQKTELLQEQEQPAQLAQRQLQENIQQTLQTKSNPFANPLAISTSGGLGAKLG